MFFNLHSYNNGYNNSSKTITGHKKMTNYQKEMGRDNTIHARKKNDQRSITDNKQTVYSSSLPVLYYGIAALAASMFSVSALAAENDVTEDGAPEGSTMVVEGITDAAANRQGDYVIPLTRSGSKMLLMTRDVPQSVSIIGQQRMQDQQLQSLNDVLDNTTGLDRLTADFGRYTYYSRGFLIDNYMIDGIPTVFQENWNLGDAETDTAVLERVEVVRGASGLMTGAGNPSASVNMVMKHANSRKFAGNVSAGYGSWNKQRYIADVSAPLTPSGNLRGRLIGGYQENNNFIDRYWLNKKFLYGVLDADLTSSTTASIGYYYQQTNNHDQPWSGVPRWYIDGSRTHYSRHYNTAADWSYANKYTGKLFVTLTQRFADNWKLTLNGSYTDTRLDSKSIYIDGYFDKLTGIGVSPYAGWPVVGGTGYNTGKRVVYGIDAYIDGYYNLFGHQHELMAGVSYNRQNNRYLNDFTNLSPEDVGNFNLWNSHYPQTHWNPLSVAQDDTLHQKSAYIATRLALADPLHVIIGARYTNWRSDTIDYAVKNSITKNNITPYAGIVYDINDNLSAYASYTSVFQPQTYRDSKGSYLSPVTGNNYEAGIKSALMNNRLTTSLAVFRIDQNNVAQSTGRLIAGSAETAYSAVHGAVSKGVEAEINGALTDNWQLTLGATRYVATDNQGQAVNSNLPRTTVKLFTAWTPSMLRNLTLGGGVNWQTRTWRTVSGPDGQGTLLAEQGSYALVDLFARYQITKQFSVQANVNNLFDKTYDTVVSTYITYGTPREFSVTATYRF